MDWITPSVAIGNCLEAQDCSVLSQFKSVLGLIPTLRDLNEAKEDTIAQLRESLEIGDEAFEKTFQQLRQELGTKRIEIVELIDGPGNDVALFRRAVSVLAELTNDIPPVLVHCYAGRSRSPAVVAGYLMTALGISAAQALDMVVQKRETYIDPALVCLLDSLEQS
jgi:protein-tyrosine phosphatase